MTDFIKDLPMDLAVIKLRKSKQLLYGLKENLKSSSTEFYVSKKYLEHKTIETDKKVYVMSPEFFEKFCIENNRYHAVNVIGGKS